MRANLNGIIRCDCSDIVKEDCCLEEWDWSRTVITLDHVGKRRIFTYSWVREQWFAGCLSIPVVVKDKLEGLSGKIGVNFSMIIYITSDICSN